MASREESFFEKHIEKIVLLVVCVISAALLVYYVFLGPCNVTYQGKKLGPAAVDQVVLKKAQSIREALDKKPVPVAPYQAELGAFAKELKGSAVVLDRSLYPQIPPYVQSTGPSPKYSLPEIPAIESARVDYFRTVAYVPMREIDQQNVYSQSNSEPNDIDIVTVEFRFDAAALCKAFNDCFAGTRIKEQWRDKTLAEPVFAAVQLQRQQSGPDGNFQANWEDVPRCKVDPYRQILDITEDVGNLPTGGLQVRLLQYREKAVQMDLIQPECYRIASTKEEWFPPSLHPRYKTILDDELRKKKRESTAAAKQAGTANPEGPPGRTAGLFASAKTTPTVSMSEIEQSPAFIQFYKDYDKILISEKTDLSKMTDPLTFWTFDDTAQPAKQYRYRIRLGVFNPIAGTDQFVDDKTPLKNKVILWTNFAEPAQVVQIPARKYFFAQVIEELKKRVTVLVGCYKLGSWYTKDFKVNPGDCIGQRIEKTGDENENEDDIAALLPGSVRKPAQVDYSTGQVLLDAVQMTEWSGGSTLYPRPYFQILYSSDGSEIFRMPVGDKYWPDDLHEAYYAVKAGENNPNTPQEAFKAFGEGRQGIKQKIIDQKQQQAPTTAPGTKGVNPALLELMKKRMGGAQQQQN